MKEKKNQDFHQKKKKEYFWGFKKISDSKYQRHDVKFKHGYVSRGKGNICHVECSPVVTSRKKKKTRINSSDRVLCFVSNKFRFEI